MLTSKLYPDCKIYGPYVNKDNRRRVVIYKDGVQVTVLAYARFLYQEYIGELLSEDEEVHHKDENTLNDSLDNYELKSRSEHRSLHGKINMTKYFEDELFICPECDNLFTIEAKKIRNVKHNKRQGKVGPFCGRSCAGKYSHR